MEDLITVTLSSEQADLVIRAVHDFKQSFYEHSRMDGDANKPRVQRTLSEINNIESFFKTRLANLQLMK